MYRLSWNLAGWSAEIHKRESFENSLAVETNMPTASQYAEQLPPLALQQLSFRKWARCVTSKTVALRFDRWMFYGLVRSRSSELLWSVLKKNAKPTKKRRFTLANHQSSITQPQIDRFCSNLVQSLITWHPMYHKTFKVKRSKVMITALHNVSAVKTWPLTDFRLGEKYQSRAQYVPHVQSH